MKVIRNINNNVCLCEDSRGRELIAFGKGIGCQKAPHEIPLRKINRTFYNVNDADFGVLKDVPSEVIAVTIKITDLAEDKLNVSYPASAVLALADHINFAIQRQDKKIYLDLPIIEDIKQLYPEEIRIAEKALEIIDDELGLSLPSSEIGVLALHLINDCKPKDDSCGTTDAEIIEKITQTIEKEAGHKIDRESFNYSRFVSHMGFLLKRLRSQNKSLGDDKSDMLEILQKKYYEDYRITLLISSILEKEISTQLDNNEKLYLLIYVNRLVVHSNI
jgi:beta-glucoside operon transcriptional antiterminator